MADSSPDYMSCTEDIEIAAVAEMMHADDVRSFEEAPMDQDTTYMAECICCVGNVHQEIPVEVSKNRRVTFDLDEITATSTEKSEGVPDKRTHLDKTVVIRRSSRIQSNTDKRKSSELTPNNSSTRRSQKRKSSEITPTSVSIRRRKSTDSPGSARKIRRTTSLGRDSKSPANIKGSNKKVAMKRKSTGQTHRQGGKFSKP